MNLSYFPHTLILRVTPGHWTKKASSGRIMQSIIEAMAFPILIHRPHDAGTIAENGNFCDNWEGGGGRGLLSVMSGMQ